MSIYAPDKDKETRQALLLSCHMDTLAMVRAWKKLKEQIK